MARRVTPWMVASGRRIVEPRLSPDGMVIAFLTDVGPRTGLVSITLGDGPSPQPGPELVLTSDPAPSSTHPMGGGVWTWLPDSSGVLHVARDGGIHHVPVGGGTGRLVVAPSSPDEKLWGPVVSPDGRWVACEVHTATTEAIGVAPLHLGDDDDRVPAAVRVLAGAPAADFRMDPAWGPDGRLSWHEWSVPAMPWDESRIVTARPATHGVWHHDVEVSLESVSVGQPRWSPDGAHLAYVGDQSGWKVVRVVAVSGPERVDRPLVDESFEHAEPTWGPGQRSFAWSPDGSHVAFNRNEEGFGRLCVAALDGGPVRELGRGWHHAISWEHTSSGHERIAAVRSGGRTPTQLVVYGALDGARTIVARGPVGGWEDGDLPEPIVLRWRAADGVEIPGRLYLPTGIEQPGVIVHVHGGPTGQTPVQFDRRQLALIDRGWAVFVPDHRGSTGWGRAHQQAMRGRWGELDVSDTADGVRHLIAERLVDPARVVAMGGSAGGFTVLGLLAHHGDLFAAGVALYPVTDLIALDETTHRYEAHYNASLIGERPQNESRYHARSPLTFADRIRRPLLVLHGDADPVVVVDQARALADAVRVAGGEIELHVYEGEGHGWSRPETVADEVARVDAFLAKHVPGS